MFTEWLFLTILACVLTLNAWKNLIDLIDNNIKEK